jgi:glycosyltransferase involved in cell wall biosynthesis
MRNIRALDSSPGADPNDAILVISPWGLRGQYSGPVTLMNRLFGALASEGRFHVDVAFRDRGQEADTDWARRVYPLVKTRAGRFSRIDQLRWILSARRFLARNAEDYRFVHLHGVYITNVLAVPPSVRKKLILLPVLENGDLPNGGGLAKVKAVLYRRVINQAFLALALSEGIEKSLVALGIPRHRVLRMNNPAASVGLGTAPIVRPHKALTIGFVGKIGPNKNPHLVLEALAEIRASGIDARAVFVGPFADEQYEAAFRALEGRLGVGAEVVVTGFVEDVQQYLAQMDVFVLPSKHEGMPGALAEAIAFGLPVVVTDVGEMAHHVRAARAGIVVSAETSEIAEALRRLSDASVRADFGASARRYGVGNFLAEGVAKAVQGKIDELERERTHDGE